MDKPIDLNDYGIDCLRVSIEVAEGYVRCQRCADGDCKDCDYRKANDLSDVLANRLRPRMPFPF